MKSSIINLAKKCLLATSILLVGVNYSHSQVLIPANDPDYRIWPTPNGFAFLSTAMIESPPTGHLLSAVAYHGHYGAGIMLQLDEETPSAITFPIQHSMYSDIDIALIDNPANPGA